MKNNILKMFRYFYLICIIVFGLMAIIGSGGGGGDGDDTPQNPTANITSPSGGSTYNEGDIITFTGFGSDTEDGTLTGSSLVWTSSINGQIDTGTSFTRNDLSAGTHTVTLTATDSDNLTGSDSVSITVSDTTPPTAPIVDTNVENCYSNNSVIICPSKGESFFGQDAHYQGNVPSYTDNGDGTITDNVTGLMWQQDMGEQITFSEAITKADTMTLGGYDDWRVPTIKELYSLILFTGSNGDGANENTYERYIDINYFLQPFGDQNNGERIIDAQTWSATEYVGTTMNGDATVFGVNFIDGRIKGYPRYTPGTQTEKRAYFRFVRDNIDYGKNNFIDNGDGTISDLSTGLMWQQADDGTGRDWENALEYAENLELAGSDDWRLPNAKELQSIVDYSRSPQTTNSAAIDPLFYTTQISDPDGFNQYPYFWTSTTHIDGINVYDKAVYIAFGEAQGKMNGILMDVHGAGAQRSDPKTGNPQDYPAFLGPQGDVRYVFNYVRCVREIE